MGTAQKFKASRYNHFVPVEDGKRLAFNAMSCGLAEMDPESYEVYEALVAGDGDGIDREKHAELIENLKKGGFLIDAEFDELAAIRAGHYKAGEVHRAQRVSVQLASFLTRTLKWTGIR